MLIDFYEAKMKIETKINAAAYKELRQQGWFLESEMEKRLDYIRS